MCFISRILFHHIFILFIVDIIKCFSAFDNSNCANTRHNVFLSLYMAVNLVSRIDGRREASRFFRNELCLKYLGPRKTS